jgi:hypothetical protein
MESIPPRRSGCAISKALPGLRGDRDAEGRAYLSFVSFEAFACQIAGLSEKKFGVKKSNIVQTV